MNQILALAESSLAALKAYRASHYKRDDHAVAALQSLQQIITPRAVESNLALPMPTKPQEVRRSPRLQQQRRSSFTRK